MPKVTYEGRADGQESGAYHIPVATDGESSALVTLPLNEEVEVSDEVAELAQADPEHVVRVGGQQSEPTKEELQQRADALGLVVYGTGSGGNVTKPDLECALAEYEDGS